VRTSPNTTCLPVSFGSGASAKKNCDVFVFFPLLPGVMRVREHEGECEHRVEHRVEHNITEWNRVTRVCKHEGECE
jgi:hypothetical protein